MTKSYDPISQVSLRQDLKELLSSHSSFVTSWKDPSNVGDVHITSGFRIKFRLLTLSWFVFSLQTPFNSTSHTQRPYHPPPTHSDRAYFRPSPWTTMQLHSELSNSLCWEHFPSSPSFLSPIILPLPQILLLWAPYRTLFSSCNFCIEYFCALPWTWYRVSSYI